MFPVLIRWPIAIYTYGFMISTGVLVSLFLILRMSKKEEISSDQIMDLIIWMLVAGFAGARVVYIIVEWKTFLAAPLRTIISRSGFVFYGGAITGMLITMWRINKMNLDRWKTLDLFAVVVPVAHAFGRLGCFAFGCCYGKECHSWLCMKFPASSPAGAAGVPVIPTQLISSAGLLILAFVLWRMYKNKKFDGLVAAGYCLFYGIMRFVIEIFRGDDRGGIWILSTSQIISIMMVIFGITLLVKLGSKKSKTNISV